MKRADAKHDEGFTLIEVIVSLLVASIFMSLIVSYLGTAFTRSASPLAQLRTTLTVFRAMENMNADYKAQYDAGTLNLVALQTAIGAAGPGTKTNAYGTYQVLTNQFIQFDGAGIETGAGGNQNILKVTIQGVGTGPFFTTFFTCDLP